MSIVSEKPAREKAEVRLPHTAARVIERCRENRGEDGAATIQAKEVAVLIRAQLKARWSRIKFSVRSDYNSVNVRWTDGPVQKLVERVIGQYSFGGFDGMIDLAYDSTNWLLPDGTMAPAASSGTEGSRGTVPAYSTDCPEPGAVLVKYGPRYVFAHREVSNEHYRVLARFLEARYGWDVDFDRPLWEQILPNGEYVPSMLRRMEQDAAEALAEKEVDHAATA